MPVRDDCRHYVHRSTTAGDVTQRCRLSVADDNPFSCPTGCIFYETRTVIGAGWTQAPSQPMSNTADGLDALPPVRRRRGRKRR
ncbi:MAG: hypothetical protein ACRDWW_05225 [Acidimicrobiales bacterium]